MKANLRTRGLALGLIAAFALTACADSSADEAQSTGGSSVTVEDNEGEKTVSLPLKSVVATDNRTFETLSDWGVELSAAAVSLMPDTIEYTKDSSIVDLGSHREPNLEAVVAVEPNLIVNGQRYTQYADKFKSLAPEATILNLDPRDDQPFDQELKRQVTVLGEVFGKQDEAKKLTEDFDAAVARVKAAYTAGDKVMGLNVSGGELGYAAPGNGRTLGPLFDIFGFTPALEVEGSEDHEGDDVSVEAIAQSNPDLILVMDRDAAVSADDAAYKPAAEVIEGSAALKNVPAIVNSNVVYAPADTYTNEGIQTYTEFFNAIADQLEKN